MLGPHDRVFHPRHGEGLVVGAGRNGNFVRVCFDGQSGVHEIEAFSLYLKA